MTIAACYLSPEGVVLGSDSTTSFLAPPGGVSHHFEYGQKIFQIGTESSMGMTTWGLGGFHDLSYRTLMACFADDLKDFPAKTGEEAANRWSVRFWTTYEAALGPALQRARDLNSNPNRSTAENEELTAIRQMFCVGFCVAGSCIPDRRPWAYEVSFDPAAPGPTAIRPLQFGELCFWGVPNLINRLIYGLDKSIFDAILASGRWNGNANDLSAIVDQNTYRPVGILPLREALDWVHAIIYATIKGMKFSHMAPLCGGPIELAVISSDRPFRWVQHKRFSAAFDRKPAEGELR